MMLMPFTIRLSRHFQAMAFVICLLSLSSLVGADSLWSGTWVLRGSTPESGLTMTVEEVGTGWKLDLQAAASRVTAVKTGEELGKLVEFSERRSVSEER